MTDKIINIDCKYYLPCGRCDKTNGLCSLLEELNVVIPTQKTSEYYPAQPSCYAPVNDESNEKRR